MSTLPRITIVTIAYNSRSTIEEAIRSVISQNYANKEYVVIDGGSTDGTQTIIRQYKNNIDVYISEKDEGISDAFNKGISHSTGDYILMLNSDDILLPDTLSRVALHTENEADILCGNLILWDDKTDKKHVMHPSTSFPIMPFLRRPAHQGAFIKRSIYHRIGGYDTHIKYAMDLDFLMRAYKQKVTFKHIDINVALFRLGGATEESIFKKKDEYCYIVRKNGGSWIQANIFYYFLVFTQSTRKVLKSTGIDWVRRIRYKSVIS